MRIAHLRDLIADLNRRLPIDGRQLDDHIQRTALLLSSARRLLEIVRQGRPDPERTLEPELVALFLQLQRLLHVQRVREDDRLRGVVDPELLVYLLRAGGEDVRVARVLPQSRPLLSKVRICDKVLL